MSDDRIGRVKTAWRGKLGITPSIRERLAFIERAAITLREKLDARGRTLRRASSAEELRAVTARISKFLDDPQRGALHRALARPYELEEGMTGRLLLEAAWDSLEQEARRTLARLEELEKFTAAWEATEAAFARDLPWHYRAALAHWRIDPTALGEHAEAPLIRGKTRALAAMRDELADVRRALPRNIVRPMECPHWPADVALSEIMAAVGRAKRLTVGHPSLERRRRLRVLSDLTRKPFIGDDPEQPWDIALAKELVARSDAGFGGRFDDIDPRGLLLLAAIDERDATLFDAPTEVRDDIRIEWESPDAFADLHFVVPLFGDFAVVRRGMPSPIQVVDGTVRMDAVVSCAAVLPPAMATTLPVASWTDGLFDVPGILTTTILHTTKRTTLRLFARLDEAHWVARIESMGTLENSDRIGPPLTGLPSIRVLGASRDLSSGSEQHSIPLIGDERRLAGLLIREVAVPVEDHPRGHLHTAIDGAGVERLKREQRFLTEAQRRIAGSLPRPIGRDIHSDGFLYAAPLSLGIAQSAYLRRVRETADGVTLLSRAIARLWRRLTDRGLGLGLYHLPSLAFALRVTLGQKGGYHLESVAVTAPFGTLLGQQYPLFPREPSDAPTHARIGGPALHEHIGAWGWATPATEARLAALAILELHATNALGRAHPRKSWANFLNALDTSFSATGRAHDEAFPPMLIRALMGPDEEIVSFMGNLAANG